MHVFCIYLKMEILMKKILTVGTALGFLVILGAPQSAEARTYFSLQLGGPTYVEPYYVEPYYVEPYYVEPYYVEPYYVAPRYVVPRYVPHRYYRYY